jgi:hypothetical protein
MAHRILLLEDEQTIADTLLFALRRKGFDVHHVPLARNPRALGFQVPNPAPARANTANCADSPCTSWNAGCAQGQRDHGCR